MIQKIKNLILKYKHIILYLIAGGITTIISISVQFVLKYFFNWPVIINTSISWICAVICAFFLNKYIVFNAKTSNKKHMFAQAISFFTARITTYLLEITFMYITVDILDQSEYIMKIIAQIFVIVINYLLSKFIIFKTK